MLSMLRKHASSWLIKVPLAVIVISFAFFFGYSSMRKAAQKRPESLAAEVDGNPISYNEYQFFYDNYYDNLLKSFKGKSVPKFMMNMVKSTALRHAVARELQIEIAKNLDITIPDEELANRIIETQKSIQGKNFDPLFYKQRYLPYFKNRYGMDYEQFTRGDMMVSTLQAMFAGIDEKPILSKDPAKNAKWKFEIITIDPKKIKKGNAEKIATELISASPKQRVSKIKALKIETKTIGPITISQRDQLAGNAFSFKDFQNIFSLSKKNSFVKKPIKVNDKFYLVKLIEKTISKNTSKDKSKFFNGSFFVDWMGEAMKSAKTKTYIDLKK